MIIYEQIPPSFFKCECRSGFVIPVKSGSGFLTGRGGAEWGTVNYNVTGPDLDIADGTCVDFDECANKEHDCNKHATCKNSEGTYRCECDAGYRGDGFECEDHNECIPGLHQAGFRFEIFWDLSSNTEQLGSVVTEVCFNNTQLYQR